MDMTVLARWTIRPRLMAIPGVANVAIWGEKDPQLQVVVDPERLRAHGIVLTQVLQAVRDATAVDAGGFVDTANQRIAIRHVPAVYSPEALGEVVVSYRNGAPLRIRDVARVVIDHAPPIGDAVINSQLGLLLIVEKQPWANTLDVTHGVEAAMLELKPALGRGAVRHDHLSAGDVHRTGTGEPGQIAVDWLRAGDRRAGRCFSTTGGRR